MRRVPLDHGNTTEWTASECGGTADSPVGSGRWRGPQEVMKGLTVPSSSSAKGHPEVWVAP